MLKYLSINTIGKIKIQISTLLIYLKVFSLKRLESDYDILIIFLKLWIYQPRPK